MYPPLNIQPKIIRDSSTVLISYFLITYYISIYLYIVWYSTYMDSHNTTGQLIVGCRLIA